MNKRKTFLVVSFLAIAFAAMAAFFTNRFTSVPDGVLINGNTLTNISDTNVDYLNSSTRSLAGTTSIKYLKLTNGIGSVSINNIFSGNTGIVSPTSSDDLLVVDYTTGAGGGPNAGNTNFSVVFSSTHTAPPRDVFFSFDTKGAGVSSASTMMLRFKGTNFTTSGFDVINASSASSPASTELEVHMWVIQ